MTRSGILSVVVILLAGRGAGLRAGDAQWKHLSSKTATCPSRARRPSRRRRWSPTSIGSGKNGFVLAFRATGPALVWYRPAAKGWDRIVIEPEFLTVEAGGAVHDIDGDGWPDLVFGGDWQSKCVWWWRNPGKDWQAGTPWERHTIKKSGRRSTTTSASPTSRAR